MLKPFVVTFGRRALQIALIMGLAAGNLIPAKALEPPPDRIAGTDRYLTAVAVSREGWDTAETVVLARGDEYADALAGVPLAHALGAPILLTRAQQLPSAVRERIVELGAGKAILLGGESAVSPAIQGELESLGLVVERIGGSNRFATAAAIAESLAPQGVETAILAYGGDFPDALAAASYAAVEGYPILLTRTAGLPAPTREALEDLQVQNTLVIGGEGVIGPEVYAQLPSPQRVGGTNRYATSVALAQHFQPANSHFFAASGLDFPDAITGAVLAARYSSGILLVQGNTPSRAVEEYITGFAAASSPSPGTLGHDPEVVEPSFFAASSGAATHRVTSDAFLYGLDFRGTPVPICPAPDFFPPGDYRVDDQFRFFLLSGSGDETGELKGTFYYYEEKPYALLPLNRPAGPAVTASFLEEQALRIRSNTTFGDLGAAFIGAQEAWGVNALYLMAHAALESSWGTSTICRNKNNLFGYGAYDSSPYSGAYYFNSPAECILWVSGIIRRNYLTEGGAYFHGPNLRGMNQRYATDPMWAIKIANVMESILPYQDYEAVERELNRARVTATSGLRLREGPGTGHTLIRTLPFGKELEIESMVVRGEHNWLKVQAGDDEGWVSGVYVELLTEPRATAFPFTREIREEEQDRQILLNLALDIHSGPGREHPRVASLPFTAEMRIQEMKMQGSNDIWYRLARSRNISGLTILGGQGAVSKEAEEHLTLLIQAELWTEGKLTLPHQSSKRKTILIDW